jgi:L-amino acid N-acyltransferase YncA
MTSVLISKLPNDIVTIIKLYTGEVKNRNNSYMKQIKKNDIRYKKLKSVNRVKQLYCATNFSERDRRGSVWFKTSDKKRHIVISVYYDIVVKSYIWEMAMLGKPATRLIIK